MALKEDIKSSIVPICLIILIGGGFFYFAIYPSLTELTETHTIVGTIERVELLSGHIASTQDKCVIAFSNNVTVILDYHAFATANNFVGKNVIMIYRNYGQIISIKEG